METKKVTLAKNGVHKQIIKETITSIAFRDNTQNHPAEVPNTSKAVSFEVGPTPLVSQPQNFYQTKHNRKSNWKLPIVAMYEVFTTARLKL